MDEIVVLENVVKEYRNGERAVRAVNGVSLSIERGSFVVVLGPSGSGKTTLLNIISGLVGPTSGQVRVAGKDISAMTDAQATRFRADSIGFVFQFFNLFPTLTVLENVEIGLALRIKDPQELRERTLKYLHMVGLEGMEAKFPDQMSGGEQQRVSVARALASQPELLIADEPTGNLDAETGETVWALLRNMNRETGTTVIAVTHWAEAAEFADKTLYLRSGRIERISGPGAGR
ncbi:MAG: ABC transporter ATP-binding protein [Methanomassiliicoccales archaeon]|nr:ABC transporter ATP-binding protein [Methanomassiliicoccales archaeon]TFG56006.1 MAG: ABC transporter ATP-binding protein [Methanomassiliicoccus sp.]